MANNKVTNRFFRTIFGIVLLMLLFIAVPPGYAMITSPRVALTSDANGDGIAGIGDTITLTCRSDTATKTVYVTSLPSLGFTQLQLVQINNTMYSAIYTVSAGNVNSQITFIFDDDSGSTMSVTTDFVLNSKRPSANQDPTTNRGSSSDGTFRKNDTLEIYFSLNNSNNGETCFADLSAIGLGKVKMGKSSGTDSFSCSVTMPANKEGTNLSFPVTCMNEAGNSVTWQSDAINYDTIEPVIQSATAVNMTSNKQYCTVGDAIKIQAVIAKYDNDILTASNSLLFPGGPVTMEKVSGTTLGASAVYEYTHFVTEENISNISTCFEIVAKDDAENEVKKTSNYIRLDTLPPEFNSLAIKIVSPVKGLLSNTAIIDDHIQIYGDMSSLMTDVTLTVDLSTIGGVNNQIIPFCDGSTSPKVATTSFNLDYTIGAYTSEHNTPRAFVVTAKDIAGNIITQVTMPVIYVDNLPPTISGGQFSNVTNPGKPVKLGDQIAIVATVGNPDNGTVYTDLSKLGGGTKSELTLNSGSTYRLDHIAAKSVDPACEGGIDQSCSFVIYAQDDGGNIVNTTSGSLMVDTEPPVILDATYTVNPPLSSTHKFVRVGDRISFKVQLASSTNAVHDNEIVTMDLHEFEGQKANTELIYTGGYYVYSFDVPNGNINNDYTFVAVATDDAGNTVSRAIPVKLDNQAPDPGPIVVKFLVDASKKDVVNIGDKLEITIPVGDPDEGYCYMDLSMIGSSSNSIISYEKHDSALGVYRVVVDCTDAQVENSGYMFTATIYDKAGNKASGASPVFNVDCVRPVCNNFTVTHIKKKGKANVINVGDQLKFDVEADSSTFDNASVTINLGKVGGSQSQKLTDMGDNLWSYTYTVAEGDTNGEDVLFKVKITDDSGNFVEKNAQKTFFVDNCPVQIDSISYTQTTDTNGNGIVDLDGTFVTKPVFATDTVTLVVNLSQPASVTADLSKFALTNAEIIPVTTSASGYKAELVFQPKKGTTNVEDVFVTVTVTDENGNQTIGVTTNSLKVDNKPPVIELSPITFEYDSGRVGEANKNDVIKIEANITGNDSLSPLVDYTLLFSANNMTPPSGTVMTAEGGNKYSAKFTIPEGLGTKSVLSVIAVDSSGNMTVVNTEPIRFMSKTPTVHSSSASMVYDENANGILNPGDIVRISYALNETFNEGNTPPAKVLVDIGGITDSTSDKYYTSSVPEPGKRCWAELTWDGNTTAPYYYSCDFTASGTIKDNRGTDADSIEFLIRVLHPETDNETVLTTTILGEFPVDTKMPNIVNSSLKMTILDENGDNTASYSANIGDFMELRAEIKNFDDFASASAILFMPTGTEVLGRVNLVRNTGTDIWIGNFIVATGTRKAGEEVGDNEWRIINEELVKFKVYATDNADNTASSTLVTPSPAIKMDNKLPDIAKDSTSTYVEYVDNNGDGWNGVNVMNGLATDSIHVKVTLNESVNATAGKGYAYIDLSPIGATSTYMLKPNAGAGTTVFETIAGTSYTDRYVHFITEKEIDLASYSFKIWVVDGAGNKDFYEDTVNLLAIDTTRPVINSMTFDGSMITIKLSERIDPTTLDVDNIRIGNANVSGVKSLHKELDINQGTCISLSSTPASGDLNDYDAVSPLTGYTDIVYVILGKTSKSKIADWGKTKLYMSLASMDEEPGEITDKTDGKYKATGLGTDIAGNWIRPIYRGSPKEITIDVDYSVRPNLVGGSYNAASTNIDGEYLHLFFDKSMDKTTLTAESLKKLAIWYNTSSEGELWNVRYRMGDNDTFNAGDQYNTSSCNAYSVGIKLSQEAKDWIALTYGNSASVIHLQVKDSVYDPPAFIRDISGNRVNPILPGKAIIASLTPLVSPFSLNSNISLDLSGDVAILTLNFEDRRARLFKDTYSATSLTINKTTPVDLSRVYICSTDSINAGKNICLGAPGTIPSMVNWNSGATSFVSLNDFASTTVRIPLTEAALNQILTWGTSRFYLRCEVGAFTDLWGNLSSAFTDTSKGAGEITTKMPTGGAYADPKLCTIAVTPIADSITGRTLFKGQAAGGFVYEVTFETASLSGDVRIPISRAYTPTLKLYTVEGDTLLDTGTFVGWGDHNMGGITRTYARFANSGLSEVGAYQCTDVKVVVEGFTDIFRPEQSFSDTITMAYDLTKKVDGAAYPTGFNQVASYPMVFDNKAPVALTATCTVSNIVPVDNIVGVTAKGNMRVLVTFDEDMNQTNASAYMPTLRLVTTAGSTVMAFNWSKWADSKTAEFTNNADFDSATTQGIAYFMISGGYDEAGNACAATTLPEFVNIRSKGPTVTAISVKTLQYTTANSADDYMIDTAFSPSVSSNYYDKTAAGVATITVTFETAPEGEKGEIRIYTVDGSTLVRTLVAHQASTGTEWYAEWDGTRDDGTLITSNYQISYMIKFFDEAGNQGSRNGTIVYDNTAPKVVEWQFSNMKVKDNTAYFSPTAQTSARINCITGDIGQTMKMRLSRPNPDESQHDIINTYVMSSLGNSGYTIAFDGYGSVNKTEALTGSWTIDLVDTAGNLGVGLNSSSRPRAGLIIDRTAPTISNITLQRVTADKTPIGDPGVNRFNARLANLKIMITDSTVSDDPLDEGTGVVKIMSGSTLIREIITSKTGSDLHAIWDGNDDNGAAVPDGVYTIKVTDLAGNEATLTQDVTLVRAIFSLTSVEQVGLDTIKMVFSQKIEETTIGAAYTITPVNPAGLQISNPVLLSDGTTVLASITPELTSSQHTVEYTVTVPVDSIKSIDGDSIAAGNNVGKFIADTKGPSISAITYDGLKSQKQFNVVFDEQIEAASAVFIANYKLTIGANDVPITAVTLRSDNKSVSITASADITEGVNYTITIKGVKDVSGNKSDTSVTFEGRDITPPVLTVTAFSTPANERDIVIAVRSNEAIAGLPTAVISQSGTVATSIQLSASGNNLMFVGGYHLDSNYPGVATIKVTAEDLSKNEGSSNYSFTTAYVKASVRASVTSADKIATAVFEKGTLKKNSVVMFLSEKLEKSNTASNTARASIAPVMISDLKKEGSARASIRAAVNTNGTDMVAQELTPMGEGYNLVIPENRLAKSVSVSMNLTAAQRAATGIDVYESTVNGWKKVNTTIASDTARFTTNTGGLFAVMRDTMAPRASLQNDLTKVVRTSNQVFTWDLTEYASGLDRDNIKAVLDGKEYDVVISTDGTVAKFNATGINSGDHEISLNVSDMAGNRASLAAQRFSAVINLKIEDVACYPNPARNYSKIRFRVTGNTINADEVTVKIYDVAGHLVADNSNIDMSGGKANIYEARWDLRNKKGKKVANGTYVAKIEVRDPLDWNRKAKYTYKIAVLK